jgi:aspartyl/glutamyl-tRNA(Asn/Gln) amidotransferase C subunit
MITKEDIEKLSELSRLSISESEKESMRKDINSILGYVGAIQEISDKAPVVTPVLQNVMREDEVTTPPGSYTERLLKEAPETKDGYVVVKKILS